MNTRRHSAIGRFLNKIRIADTGCWIWQASTNGVGYGQFVPSRPMLAHRFAYQYFIGELIPSLEIDHICRVKLCVNPLHLRQVTRAENLTNWLRPPCARCGKETTVNAKGERRCFPCQKIRGRESAARWLRLPGNAEIARQRTRDWKRAHKSSIV
jgi:hypothetical protein